MTNHLTRKSGISGESPPLPSRTFFGRDEFIERVVDLADKFTPIALIGPGGIGKTPIALALSTSDSDQSDFDCELLKMSLFLRILTPHSKLRESNDSINEFFKFIFFVGRQSLVPSPRLPLYFVITAVFLFNDALPSTRFLHSRTLFRICSHLLSCRLLLEICLLRYGSAWLSNATDNLRRYLDTFFCFSIYYLYIFRNVWTH